MKTVSKKPNIDIATPNERSLERGHRANWLSYVADSFKTAFYAARLWLLKKELMELFGP